MTAAVKGLVACLLLVAVAAACGSDESTSASSSEGDTTVNTGGDSVETDDDVEVEILGSSRASTSTTTDSDDNSDEVSSESESASGTQAAGSSEITGSGNLGGATGSSSGNDTDSEGISGPVPTTALTAAQRAELEAVIQVSTTSPAGDVVALEETANEIIEAWWFNPQDRSFGDLADELTESSAVSAEFADVWRQQSANPVEDQSGSTELVAVVPVRVEEDNATVQVASTNDAGSESVSFFEFELYEGDWTLVEVIS